MISANVCFQCNFIWVLFIPNSFFHYLYFVVSSGFTSASEWADLRCLSIWCFMAKLSSHISHWWSFFQPWAFKIWVFIEVYCSQLILSLILVCSFLRFHFNQCHSLQGFFHMVFHGKSFITYSTLMGLFPSWAFKIWVFIEIYYSQLIFQ